MKKKILFSLIVSITLAGLLALTSVLNIVSFTNNYTQSTAANNAIVTSGVVSKLEYSLKYGKSLENYYGIEDLFEQVKQLCGYVDEAYIVDTDGGIIYENPYNGSGFVRPDEIEDNAGNLDSTQGFLTWTENDTQHILIPVNDSTGNTVAGFGITYSNEVVTRNTQQYVSSIVFYTVIAAIAAILLFILLFFVIRHDFAFKKLLLIVIPIIIASNLFLGVASFYTYRAGYTALTKQTADTISVKIRGDIKSVVDQGIHYSELNGLDEYFSDVTKDTNQIGIIELKPAGEAAGTSAKGRFNLYSDDIHYTYPFEPDSEGIAMDLHIEISEAYLKEKLNAIIVEILVSIVTSLMIAAEVIIFIVALLTGLKDLLRKRKMLVTKDMDEDMQSVGSIRGLFFFFAMFQYMAMAFIPIVMASIYKPIFGLPYEIAMSIPMTVQILTSILSSWICGRIVDKKGWRPVAVTGILIMVIGTVVAAMAKEPILFILAQIIMGLGLGCAKTSFDIFSVLTPSSQKLEEYTSSINAGLIVGMSCSAAIGAIIADVFGYSGAFLVMGGFGLLVVALILLFSVNIRPGAAKAASDADGAEGKSTAKFRFDVKFFSYILFLVVPYFFISMYLDYFFPVYADTKGMSTASIGHIFLLYGISTSYIGAFLCSFLSKRIKNIILMSSLLTLLGVGMGWFALSDNVVYAVALVLLIAVIDGIMPSLQYRYVYSLEISKKIGISRTIGIEGAFSSAIRGVAPVIFGFVMMYGNRGLLVTGIVVVVFALSFLCINKFSSKGVVSDEKTVDM
jgi:predicted MFS family arabinose efflux permease